MKATASYKMTKALKTSLALSHFTSNEQRHAWKRAMIGAELAAAFQPKREKGKRGEE